MDEMKLTDKKIIKALECMAGITPRDCDNCPFMVNKFCSDTALAEVTLDFIQRLQAEKEELKQTKFSNWKVRFFKAKDEIERLTEEKWQAQDDLDNYHEINRELEKRNAELQKQVDELKAWKERLKIDLENEKNWGKIQTKQAVEDTAQEIYNWLKSNISVASSSFSALEKFREFFNGYGVEV